MDNRFLATSSEVKDHFDKRQKFLSLSGSSLILLGTIILSSAFLPVHIFIVSAQTTPPPIWPTIQHDFQRTSAGSYPGPSSNSTDWIFGPTGSVSSSPVVGSDGTIYFVDDSFHLFAVNPDGSVRWEKTFNEGLFSPAIGPNGVIYVPGSRHLFAFYSDGDSPWTAPFNFSTSRGSALAISPQGILFEVNSAGALYAINPFGTTASSLWNINASCIPSTLALGASGSLYCGTTTVNGTGANLIAISPNGLLQWTFPTSSIISVPPAVAPGGDLFVVSSGGDIFALNPSGALLWDFRVIHQEVTSAVIGPNGEIYVAGTQIISGQIENVVAAISQSSNEELWEEPCYLTPSSFCFPFGVVTSMAVDSAGNLYVGTNTSGLVALNANGGLIWSYTNLPTGEGNLSPIGMGANGTLYVGTGCLFCNVTTYGNLLAIGQPNGYYSFSVSESGLPSGNAWSFLVNGENYSTSSSSLLFSLPNGSYSWQTPPSLVPDTVGVRYAASVLQGNFSIPFNGTFALSFSIEYQLNVTAVPNVGGNVSPPTGQWYIPGSTVQLNSTSFPGYGFGIWNTLYGSNTAVDSSTSQTNVQVNGPGSIEGIFDPFVTLSAGSGGSVQFLDPPYVGTLQPGQSVSFYAPSESVLVLTARPLSGYSFQIWNASSNLVIDSTSSVLQFKVGTPSIVAAQFSNVTTVTKVTALTSTSTTFSNLSSSSTSTSVPIATVPKSSVLPTRNVALDAIVAIIVGLVVVLGVIVIVGVIDRKAPNHLK